MIMEDEEKIKIVDKEGNRFSRRPVLTLITVNIILLIFILGLVELILRLTGSKTILQEEFNQIKEKNRLFCEMLSKGEIVHKDSYFTDCEGIFKRRPGKGINSDGFRGLEFKYLDTNVTRILLLGDSFTFGHSARPRENCFADLLQNDGYYVYNSGIGGTDLLQYARIAKKYIPLLKPDGTAVMLFMGNDINVRPHPIKPGKNLFYATNVGWLRGYDDRGRYFENFEEAMGYYAKKRCGKCTILGDWFFYKTVIGKTFYNLLFTDTTAWFIKKDSDRQWVTDALKEIKTCCEKNGSQFILFLIPIRKDSRYKHIEKHKHIFQDFDYYYPLNLTIQDYMSGVNHHFNNQGHRKYFEFMKKTLNEEGIHPLKK